ncbi:tRNA 5-methylaminomethyl-2-thiouridine biosynthesis bifunctional protein MnmC [Novipirellula galeiformis]|uniref:tRNA 5-methylaminomethyl-2-thiouridine biosynthesis bifunctional protein MnmC n=1 Tax=Novipirellula galeiformis TaxID=2528004 RepID=A0A5C6BZB3_9BACT|nr:tRNA (5-methylaminomethyl-2-thiouridine)(34)-methyltransferase MnmD [Novipirellula galeiformis]TWU17690.1 tRNA 5-methylaminomethyl-2-thiouridine biosynthesis bifunctional protein MnmC [Novipirellula galeiformis]
MNQRVERTKLPCDVATLEIEVTDDGSRTLKSRVTGDSYHSASGALCETRHVYLLNSGIQERLSSGQSTRVLEIGLGTGMGMFVTVDCAIAHKTQLHYVAVEYEWISAPVVASLAPETWVSNPSIVANYLKWRAAVKLPSAVEAHGEASLISRPPHDAETSVHHWQAGDEQEVAVHLADVLAWDYAGDRFDAIYFDPFAPETNTELWQTATFEKMYKLLPPGGRLVTYCVKREVRDRLSAVGFKVRKTRGPAGGKREVLVAEKAG